MGTAALCLSIVLFAWNAWFAGAHWGQINRGVGTKLNRDGMLAGCLGMCCAAGAIIVASSV